MLIAPTIRYTSCADRGALTCSCRDGEGAADCPIRLLHAEGRASLNSVWTKTNPKPLTWGFIMERVTRIELALSAWVFGRR
ncbi:hypothetical protein GCM10010344_67470 [Streptomyces bluensis]|nr:hypothetical protein GCM10010344_67470 [Streptomyces bluensis]